MQAQGRWVQAGLYPNPQIGYMGTEIGNEGQAGQEGGYITQTLVTGGKLGLSQAAAAQEVNRARWEAQAQQWRVLTDVRLQFYEALGAQQTVALAEELRGIAEEGVRISRQLENILQAPHTDVLQSEVELSTVDLLLQTSRQREDAVRRQLAALAGMPELPPAPLVGSLEDESPRYEWSEACGRLFAANPLLLAAQARIGQARAQVQRERVEPIPNVNFQIGSQYDFATDYAVHMAQVQLPLPLYDRNQGNVTAAVADLRRAMDEANRIRLQLQQRLAEVWRRYETAYTQAEIYRTRILPRSRETLDLTTQAYEGGQLDFLRVLTARRTFFENRMEYLKALIELRRAEAELQGFLLTGGLDAPAEGTQGTTVGAE
jgi:cobalt-zinc-cadmium efflux system outer membrane protein